MRLANNLLRVGAFLGLLLSSPPVRAAGPYCFQNWIDTACNASYIDCGEVCAGYGTPVCVGTGQYTPDSIYCPWREIEACECH